MNDFVLRGFCQECECSLFMHLIKDGKEGYTVHCGNILCGDNHDCEPVWFLSPKQMKIVGSSKKFQDWFWEYDLEQYEALAEYVEKYPFLVSKILKDAGEKSKEENK